MIAAARGEWVELAGHPPMTRSVRTERAAQLVPVVARSCRRRPTPTYRSSRARRRRTGIVPAVEKSRTILDLPRHVQRPYDVYVNGVAQTEGADFEVFGSALVFERPLARAPRLGFWRWVFVLCFGIVVGGYDPHDTIDVVYTLNGRRTVASLTPPRREKHSAPRRRRETIG
jgi:hypothetical protein